MGVKIDYSCPLGGTCEKVTSEGIERCTWYTKLAGSCPNTGVQVNDWKCAISWIPLMLVEVTSTNTSVSASVDSFRNETVKGQEEFNNILKKASIRGNAPLSDSLEGMDSTDVLLGE